MKSRRLRTFVLTAALLLTISGCAEEQHLTREAQITAVGEKLMCNCGCNQILITCTHGLTCPNSGPMKEELAQMVDAGQDEDSILAAFAQKYGTVILAAPPVSGFNLTAWITPFFALLVGMLMMIYFVRTWKSRTPEAAPAGPIDARYQDRLEEELKKYTPED